MGVSVDMSASHSVSASLPRLLRQRLSALMLATSLGLAAPVAMAQSLPPPDIVKPVLDAPRDFWA